jgi:hypothetical protein
MSIRESYEPKGFSSRELPADLHTCNLIDCFRKTLVEGVKSKWFGS